MAEPEPELVTDSGEENEDDDLVGYTMVTTKAPPIREGVDEKSPRRGNLKKGERFVVLETTTTEDGVERIRMEKGWISRRSKTGVELVVVDSSVLRLPDPADSYATAKEAAQAEVQADTAAAREEARAQAHG